MGPRRVDGRNNFRCPHAQRPYYAGEQPERGQHKQAAGNSLNLTGGVTGTGNLIFAATSAGGFILGPTGTVNFTGTISNISTGGAGFGITANMTGAESLLQNSATSSTTVSGPNTYTGGTTISLGLLEFTQTDGDAVLGHLDPQYHC